MHLRIAALITITAMSSACGVSTGGFENTSPVGARSEAVVVGAFNFSESQTLAHVYAGALRDAGIESEVLDEGGSREMMQPALQQGQVDVLPEYLGAALTFFDPGSEPVPGVQDAHALLQDESSDRGLRALGPAPGANRNELVVTRQTQLRYNLRTISDLGPLASQLTLGGPPECPARPLCLPGMENVYDLDFHEFVPLDSGGPATVAALRGEEIEVAVLFTTNPAIELNDFVVLADDKKLQPAENLVPVLREEIVEKEGDLLVRTIDQVSSRLTTRTLRTLNAKVEIDGRSPETVASEWLRSEGLI